MRTGSGASFASHGGQKQLAKYATLGRNSDESLMIGNGGRIHCKRGAKDSRNFLRGGFNIPF